MNPDPILASWCFHFILVLLSVKCRLLSLLFPLLTSSHISAQNPAKSRDRLTYQKIKGFPKPVPGEPEIIISINIIAKKTFTDSLCSGRMSDSLKFFSPLQTVIYHLSLVITTVFILCLWQLSGILRKRNYGSPRSTLPITMHVRTATCKSQLKGRERKRPPRILAKLNIVKNIPNFTCGFVYVCFTLTCISFRVSLLSCR